MQESGVLEEGTRDILQEEGVQLNNSISASQEAREEGLLQPKPINLADIKVTSQR